MRHFIDQKQVRTLGGRGGDGSISFLRLWCNENAGPDGGDGGHGGHVVFHATSNVRDLIHVTSILKGEDGEKGSPKDCHGKNASHTVVKVPVGTIFKNDEGNVVGDLNREGLMFIAARGGAGGKGNRFFVTNTEQAPQICEYGSEGEDFAYAVEVKSMAHIGLIGFPNAGKSTLLRAISRARPKVAPYPFTTLKPHLGMVMYDDYEQIAVADLPGLIEGSHQNRGLGIQFLRHIERCAALVFVIDASLPDCGSHFEKLKLELEAFNADLMTRPMVIVANKIDLPEAKENVELLKKSVRTPIIEISAKDETNLESLLEKIREIYDQFNAQEAVVDS